MSRSTTIAIRGKPIDVDVLDEVIAARTGVSSAHDEDEHDVSASVARRLHARPLDWDQFPELSPFADSGWSFYVRDQDAPPADTAGMRMAQVVRLGNRGYRLATDLMTVKLSPDLDTDRAMAILRDEGLILVRRLPFGRNLFAVRVSPGDDVVDRAAALHLRPYVIAAEPDFLEPIGHR